MNSTGRVRYGVDLGTTNSAVATLTDGQPQIIKNREQHDTTPSAVGFRKEAVFVGGPGRNLVQRGWQAAVRDGQHRPTGFEDFKRSMGTDRTYTPHGGHSYGSAELSAEVLRKLRTYVEGEAGSDAAIITIPAAFGVRQQKDTQRAARAAGFSQCTLLQEPVAASMAFGLDSRHPNGMWMVFDFGGGTFDAALVLAEDGVITVKDTQGDNHLGGRDLDLAVVDGLLVPAIEETVDLSSYRSDPRLWRYLRNHLRRWAEEININLSFSDHYRVLTDLEDIVLKDGSEIELDLDVTRESLEPCVAPIFQPAIDKTKELLARHHVTGRDLDQLILVGGPTHSPLLRTMIADQIREPSYSQDPMTVVAKGAALFGLTIPVNPDLAPSSAVSDGKKLQLDIQYESTTVSDTEWVSVLCADGAGHGTAGPLEVELRGVNWTSGRHSVDGSGAVIEVRLDEGRLNTFEVIATTSRGTRIATHPSEVAILQGTKVGGATLTKDLGIEVLDEEEADRVFTALEGAKKARPLPVTGVRRSLHTTSRLRPGMASDELVLALWEGETDADGTRIALNDFVCELRLTGEQVDRLIPAGSEFHVTLKTQETINLPELVTLEFPSLQDYKVRLKDPETRSKDAGLGWVEREVAHARRKIERSLAHGNQAGVTTIGVEVEDQFKKLRRAVEDGDRDAQDQTEDRLKEALIKLYKALAEGEWPRLERKLRKAYEAYGRAAREKGSPNQYVAQVERLLASGGNDLKSARQMLDELRHAEFDLMKRERAIQLIYAARAQFQSMAWKDGAEAQEAVEEGLRTIAAEGPDEELFSIAAHIFGLIDFDESDPVLADGIPRL